MFRFRVSESRVGGGLGFSWYICMNRWMDGWMDGWMDRFMGRQRDVDICKRLP